MSRQYQSGSRLISESSTRQYQSGERLVSETISSTPAPVGPGVHATVRRRRPPCAIVNNRPGRRL